MNLISFHDTTYRKMHFFRLAFSVILSKLKKIRNYLIFTPFEHNRCQYTLLLFIEACIFLVLS